MYNEEIEYQPYGYEDLENISDPWFTGSTLDKATGLAKYSALYNAGKFGITQARRNALSVLDDRYIKSRGNIVNNITGTSGGLARGMSGVVEYVTGYNPLNKLNNRLSADNVHNKFNKYISQEDWDTVFPGDTVSRKALFDEASKNYNEAGKSVSRYSEYNSKYNKYRNEVKTPHKLRLFKKSSGNRLSMVDYLKGSDENTSFFRPGKSFFMNRNAKTAMALDAAIDSQLDILSDNGIDTVASRRSKSKVVHRALSKMNRAKWLGRGITTAATMALAKPVASYVLGKATSIMNRVNETSRLLNRMEFGTGEIMDNSKVASERQKQIMALQNASINARGLMGNEAQYFTR